MVPKLDEPSENKLPNKEPVFRNFLRDKFSSASLLSFAQPKNRNAHK